MNKRDRVMAAVHGHAVDAVPSGFWYHFPVEYHHGKAAVDIHKEFLEKTDTDILKIMNENLMPCPFAIASSQDWKHMQPISADAGFIQDQAGIVKRIVDAVDGEAAVIVTIHGTVASAYHARRGPEDYDTYGVVLRDHLRERPQLVGRAFGIAAEGAAEMTRQSRPLAGILNHGAAVEAGRIVKAIISRCDLGMKGAQGVDGMCVRLEIHGSG